MTAPRAAANVLDSVLRSPFSGLAPWILMAVLTGPGRFEIAAAAALALNLLVMLASRLRGITIHAIDYLGLAFFVLLTVIGLLASDDVIATLERWAGELTTIVLALFVFATIAVRRPFTLPYAKETTPEEHWHSPVFLRINYTISTVWGLAFTFSAACGLFGLLVLKDGDDFWTGWILPLAALFFAVTFTEFYPDYATAVEARRQGEPEPVPAKTALVAWIPTFVLIVGIVGWITGDIPDAVAGAMLALGIAGNILIGKFFRSDEEVQS
ncbi:DUF3159 domain-containing protein [Mycolicibacterium palauense]|uniref:hypothetical protein n=1 Tax=Mycolicibacterium palauense TaxID=2034511 RepID=UPI000BFEAEBE|nr:hypothetical protein [Mycolicibacterium palauense]